MARKVSQSISGLPSQELEVETDHFLTSWQLVVVIGTLYLGVFLYGLDANILNTAIPQITTDFKSLPDVAWYGAAYLLTVTAFQPFFGNLYKFFNNKIVYLISLLIFEAGSAVCAAAPSSNTLIAGRAILGLGASGILQGALAIIGNSVPLNKVPMFQGIVISGLGISLCIGPIAGGSLTQYATWRWCFWINVPCGVVSMIVVLLFVPLGQKARSSNRTLPFGQKLQKMDPVGTALFLGLVCCILLALTWGGQKYAWSSSRIIGLLVGFAVLLIIFALWDWRQGESALIPARVLLKRSVGIGAITLFLYGIVMYTYGYYLPFFFQSVQGTSATTSGVRYIAMMIPQIVSLVVTGIIVTKFGYYVPYMIAGGTIASIGSGLLTTIDMHTHPAKWAGLLALTGVGVGMASQLPYTALQVVLDPADIATGNAIAVFSSQLGGALSLAIGQNLLVTELARTIPKHTLAVTPGDVISAGAAGLASIAHTPAVLQAVRESYSEAERHIFIFAATCACLTVFSSFGMEWLNVTVESRKRKDSNAGDNVNEDKKGVVQSSGCKTPPVEEKV